MFSLTNNLKLEIKKNIDKKDEECCGLIVKTGEGIDNFIVFPCHNTNKHKSNYFQIDSKDYLKASLMGQITACYHTHVNDKVSFSYLDKINCYNNKINYILYHVPSDCFFEMAPDDSISYINKPFCWGKSDCFTLVQDYYKKEKNVTIGSISYTVYDVSTLDNPTIQNFYLENGFRRLNKIDDLQKDDIICFCFYKRGYPIHLSIYLGHGYFLHHPRNGYSIIQRLTSLFASKIVACLRYGF